MTSTVYYMICAVLTLGVLVGIAMMSKVPTAVKGNLLSAGCTLAAVLVTLYRYDILSDWLLWGSMAIGLVIGLVWTVKIKMIEMPQLVAFFNGLGGAASMLVALLSLLEAPQLDLFSRVTASLAMVIGSITFTGSMIAAGKLHKILSQKSIVWPAHQAITTISLVASAVCVGAAAVEGLSPLLLIVVPLAISGFFGIAFAIRIGGADMPITISLLNSLSGVAGSIAGMAIGDPLLVAIGGVVGASGLLLTQIMCRAMNRSLGDILLGKTSAPAKPKAAVPAPQEKEPEPVVAEELSPAEILREAKKVIIVPGYGMALAQAQHLVKQLSDKLEANGTEVLYAIHPVAGRMPGHMNVLLCEADVPYEKLHEMEEVNPEFDSCDAAIIIGANDVVNPAARDAEGTPIYGMPVLNVDHAKHIIICNYDLKPGYAGVDNPLYSRKEGVSMLLGDASQTLAQLLADLSAPKKSAAAAPVVEEEGPAEILREAKKVIIVPGYGMALAQAQHLVKQLSDKLEANGTEVLYAIHPVAGRMPGHMNVLLCEADVPYEKLHEMEEVNPEFDSCDAAIIIGANDVVNPAARDAEGTPIYGMPVLDVDHAKHIIICNYDLKPGYAGVDNPLYSRKEGVSLLLGDAAETLSQLLQSI